MANDRIYLCCKKCHEPFLLMKYYPSGPFVPDYNGSEEWIKRLDTFMTKHLQECQLRFEGDLGDDPSFTVENEKTLMALAVPFLA